MIPTRLTRLLHLLTLLRQGACGTLRSARLCFGEGLRARGLRSLRLYRRLKADLERLSREVRLMLTALLKQPAASY